MLFVLLFSFSGLSANLIHPLDFNGTQNEKKRVRSQIKSNADVSYLQICLGELLTLRMMLIEELNAFKKLTKVKNRQLLNSLIKHYCSIGLCSYRSILMGYNDKNKASQEKLDW